MFYSSPEIFVEPPTANSLGSNNNNHDENNVSDSEDHESGQIKDRKSVFIAYTKTRGKLETSRALIANSGIVTGGIIHLKLFAVVVSDPFTGKLYIHGGVHDVSIPTAKYFKDFFILHGDDLSWSPIGTTGINMPPSRIDHAAVLIANRLVIVCGPNIDPCIGHTAVYVYLFHGQSIVYRVTVSNMIPSNKNIISLLVLELAVVNDINTDNGARLQLNPSMAKLLHQMLVTNQGKKNSFDSRPLEKPPIIYKLSLTIIVECTNLDTLKSHFLIKIDSYGDVAMYPNLDFRLNPSPEIVSIRVVKVEDEGGLGLMW
nr:4935_t:CDS:2 [Entrophospora candida]